ncbi:hypothetical protein NCCP1664_17480 [Zafaria cholistanensis]|uniref:Uncharacterized protein n=1 Tax=Zafaria cholistanensis TaxID=1682741 RepID=A0A5A7NSV4_9MICC|nr:hypothetical protein [Zafaria cholistanensis]GER23252.1 hypothetical protein NCCP1664_17480 [Zafaria cholistanensis]
MESLESGGRQAIPIHVDRAQQAGLDPASWILPRESSAGEPGVPVESFAAEVPGVPEFEKGLPMLRAGGSGQGCTYIGVAEPAPPGPVMWDSDGDGG